MNTNTLIIRKLGEQEGDLNVDKRLVADWEPDSPQSSPQLPPDSPQSDGRSPQSGRLARLAADVAALVDRDAEKLQSRFLTAMVKEGVLELRYPDVRNRPDQAYRSVSPGAPAT